MLNEIMNQTDSIREEMVKIVEEIDNLLAMYIIATEEAKTAGFDFAEEIIPANYQGYLEALEDIESLVNDKL